jgi:SAM-dependent methyltransferase
MTAEILFSPLHNVRRFWSLRNRRSRDLRGVARRVEESADAEAIAALWNRVAPVYRRDSVSAAKYAQPRQWLDLNAGRIAELGLDKASGLRVLDIGCGPGYFIALARALGHDAYGVDAPDSILNDVERDVYSSLTTALHCRAVVSPLLIERFQAMPFREEPFDLITAFWICFNRHRQPDEWGAAEWRYFVEDAITCLRPGGRLVLELNENAERYGALRFYDQPTREYFASVGIVQGGHVIVTRP